MRAQYGLKGKHPADMCINAKNGKPSCHGCRTNTCENVCGGGSNDDMVAEITRLVLEKLGK